MDEPPAGPEPVEPGLLDIRDRRPDPDQPPIAPVPAEFARFAGITTNHQGLRGYGGVLVRRA